ncbi:hypothetical protein CHARACLAT_029293 [Characodon lateralis]|uniref:Uncharacterized protein n=1 Tax=Characodon lateralis TaxID=208331 RepID=A0ABU7ENA1_9TELE|nr:hypothetical protein [Characodon lateralis]
MNMKDGAVTSALQEHMSWNFALKLMKLNAVPVRRGVTQTNTTALTNVKSALHATKRLLRSVQKPQGETVHANPVSCAPTLLVHNARRTSAVQERNHGG